MKPISKLLCILAGAVLLFSVGSCKKAGSVSLDGYTIPDYPDDNTAISSWDNHDQWNLANVHDPTVAFYDGYYYMYHTSASVGNEHMKSPKGKIFYGRRSKDLINWELVPGPFNEAPAWAADSLDVIRTSMGIATIPRDEIRYGYWAPVVRTITVDGVTKLRMYYCVVILNQIEPQKPGSRPVMRRQQGGPQDWNRVGGWEERAFIGMCESTDPENGVWEDKGYVTCSASDLGRDGWRTARHGGTTGLKPGAWQAPFFFNAIDPTYIVTPEGEHYVIYGSWHSGIALLQVDPVSGKPLNEYALPYFDNAEELQAHYGLRIGTRDPSTRWQGTEGPEIIYKDGYYYLFLAYDGVPLPYNTRVVRSKDIRGPYLDIRGHSFTAGEGDSYPIVTHPYKFDGAPGWVGVSHCCVFKKEGADEWFYASQGRLPRGANGNHGANNIMMGQIRRIVWCPASPDEPDNLWPIALPERYAGLPDAGKVTKKELVGTWEHIDLFYNYDYPSDTTDISVLYDYSKQDISEKLVLAKDGTMRGALEGKWSFDAKRQQLTLGDVVVCVAREADWEAEPRKATIVYAGTRKDIDKTYWGKKVAD